MEHTDRLADAYSTPIESAVRVNQVAASEGDAIIEKFNKHISPVLRQQIISQLANQFRNSMRRKAEDHIFSELPKVASPLKPSESDMNLTEDSIGLDDSFGDDSPSMKKTESLEDIKFLKRTKHFLQQQQEENNVPAVQAVDPSIERFHAALLFVDISGFTALSQRLHVDELRIHINSYFTKILDVVTKYDGEVIKFAGDALYIIWRTKVTSLQSPKFNSYSEATLQKAVTCGVEINATCSNYKISFDSSVKGSSRRTSLLGGGSFFSPANTNGRSTYKSDEDAVAYLNVHSGVSMGVIAGMDVGANDRWEYLIFGQPLRDVAKAEAEADKGQLVISSDAHSILHPSSFRATFLSASQGLSATDSIGSMGSGSEGE